MITIIGTYWLLFGNRSRPSDSEAKTGHVYDGIEEYDNPLPAWWLYMFVITGVFGVGYLVAFPGLGNFQGLLGWSQIDQWEREVQRAEARFEPVFAAYRDLERARWRAVVAIEPGKPNKLLVRADELAISAALSN